MKNKHLGSSFDEYVKQVKAKRVSFGDRLYRERLSENMSQKELSEITGISRQTICYFENNKRDPTLSNAIKLANCLGFYLLDLKPRKG